MKEKVEKLTKKEQKEVLDLINNLICTISVYLNTLDNEYGRSEQTGKAKVIIRELTKGLENDFDCLGKTYFMKRVAEYKKETLETLQIIKERKEENLKYVNNHRKK